MVRREVLASEEIIEMLPVELRDKAQIVSSRFKELDGDPEVALQR